MCKIKARVRLNGHELTDVPTINPGDWFGKTWLLEIGGSYAPLFLIVEADSAQDAINELADSEKYGHHIVVGDDDLGDYDPAICSYGPSGQVIDLDWLMIHGMEGTDVPFPCRYFGGGLPEDGMSPADFHCREEA